MKKSLSVRLLLSSVVAALCLTAPAFGAVDMFLELDGIKGESRGLPGSLDAVAYSHEIKSPRDAASGLATGKRQHAPSFSDFTIDCPISKSSPELMLACCQGTHIKQAILTCRKTGGDGQPFLVVTMSDVLISSYSSSGHSSDDRPMESLSLNFTKIEFKYTIQKADGSSESVSFGWDLATNKKL